MKVCNCSNPTTYMGPGSSTSYNDCSTCGHVKKDFYEYQMKIKAEMDALDKDISEAEQKMKQLRAKRYELQTKYVFRNY